MRVNVCMYVLVCVYYTCNVHARMCKGKERKGAHVNVLVNALVSALVSACALAHLHQRRAIG